MEAGSVEEAVEDHRVAEAIVLANLSRNLLKKLRKLLRKAMKLQMLLNYKNSNFKKEFNLTKNKKISEQISQLHQKLEELAEKYLLPKYKEIDPNLKAGYTGSFKTGTVGNPNKSTYGQPIDLSNYDIDYYIKSDILSSKYGNSLKADPEFRAILAKTPGFEGLKPNKQGFSIKFKPLRN
ncbi:DNA polymerase elongation subunit (family B) [Paenibacillus sp. SORGH_AS338]|nr:DNA polymerase elongation subunit (family B) [Paenibacillus sp. SORGH_AS_0338]